VNGVRQRPDAEEKNMKKRMFSLGRVAVALLLFAALATCVPPGGQSGTAPEGALSVDDLLANLDALQGTAARNLTPAGKSVFTSQAGQQLSLTDLATYLNAIKQGFASAVRAHGSPYLVLPVRVSHYGPDSSLSGLMWVPFTWGRFLKAPIISYQHGTQVYRPQAPSRFDPNPLDVFTSPDQTGALQNYVECIVGGLLASAGYIVLMPDYQGFGDSQALHPYVHASLGDSVRDLILAARDKLGSGPVVPNGKIFLTGYSEGGYATMAAARSLQKAGIPVAATVPCDGPYDLSGVMREQMISAQPVLVPSYVLYTASGYHSVYGDNGFAAFGDLLQSNYATLLLNGLFDGTHTNAYVSQAVPPTVIPSISILSTGALADLKVPKGLPYTRLAENDGWAGWVPLSPLVLIHCPTDDIVPYPNAVVARGNFIAAAQLALGSAFNPAMIPPIVDVQPVPFVAQLLGSRHMAAYPAAMLAAFTAIETVNRGF
jgi:pimeloyl-ACP methyl ester carboxylesterase